MMRYVCVWCVYITKIEVTMFCTIHGNQCIMSYLIKSTLYQNYHRTYDQSIIAVSKVVLIDVSERAYSRDGTTVKPKINTPRIK